MAKSEVPSGAIAGGVAEFLARLATATGDSSMHTPQILLLLALYQNPDMNQLDLPKYTGVERSANSRNLSKLGQGERPLVARGPGLVEAYEDLHDRRFKRARLTPKGKALIDSVIAGAWPAISQACK